jgi:hypothetical protein
MHSLQVLSKSVEEHCWILWWDRILNGTMGQNIGTFWTELRFFCCHGIFSQMKENKEEICIYIKESFRDSSNKGGHYLKATVSRNFRPLSLFSNQLALAPWFTLCELASCAESDSTQTLEDFFSATRLLQGETQSRAVTVMHLRLFFFSR